MPLTIEGGRIPPRWAEKKNLRVGGLADYCDAPAECLRLALVNNMPDPALEDTEMQFFELLDTASDEVPVSVKLYSLPELPRGERGQEHLDNFYSGFDELKTSQFDGVIITGTEPKCPDLREEPYWDSLVDLLEWAEQNTASTVLSCLAAHASVLHSDGILRCPLNDKRFGVFAAAKVCQHPLTRGIAKLVRFPHSRWNEVRADALAACGYVVLTQSPEAGVDSFVKQKQKSLFVHFQGHPEYAGLTLMKEYRRDIRRFLNRERETYPSMPHGYFDAEAAKLLNEFRETAEAHPNDELMAVFPEAAVVDTLQNTWHSSARRVYCNWLEYLAARRGESSVFPAAVRVSHG
jgi:homoserine O-succinyltransferase